MRADAMMNRADWQALVPEVELRPQQFDALAAVWGHFESSVDAVFLEAPTGVGKSIIQLALGRKIAQGGGGSYIVTPQRALQDQMRGWEGTRIMKGRGTYECLLTDGTAATAPCTVSPDVRDSQPECQVGSCPFYTALHQAIESPMVVHNYSSLMAQSIIGGHFGQRELLCLDEGHTAANWIRKFMTFELTREELGELSSEEPPWRRASSDKDRKARDAQFLEWFVGIVDSFETIPMGLSDELKVTLMRAKACKESFRAVPWAVEYSRDDDEWTVLPLRVAPIAWTLTGLGRKLLVVSATILHKRLMSAELGLGQKRVEMVKIESAFPAGNRPIVRRYAGSMSRKHRDSSMASVIRMLREIADRHRMEAGMVHTVSHALALEVYDALTAHDTTRTIVLLPSDGQRDKIIREFLSGALGPSAILIGPSLMEGIDGKDDSCRWQAMVKAPWPNMGDPVVRELFDCDGDALKWANAWYNWKAAQSAVQGFGRVCRTPDDHGVTYLIDNSFQRVLDSGYIPGYVKDAIR
jgi:ATP-dependent DNA helicase DinG